MSPLPSGHASRATKAANNIRIAIGHLDQEPLTKADAALVRKALGDVEKRVQELES